MQASLITAQVRKFHLRTCTDVSQEVKKTAHTERRGDVRKWRPFLRPEQDPLASWGAPRAGADVPTLRPAVPTRFC